MPSRHAGIEIELPKTAVASTLEPLIFMAEQGLGIAYLPDFAIRPATSRGLLVTVLDDYTDRSGPLRDPVAIEPASRSQAQSISWTFSPRTLSPPSRVEADSGISLLGEVALDRRG